MDKEIKNVMNYFPNIKLSYEEKFIRKFIVNLITIQLYLMQANILLGLKLLIIEILFILWSLIQEKKYIEY